MKLLHVFWGLFVLGLTGACSPSFSSEDIAAMKKTIKEEFEKRDGITVVDVVMIKESSTKATGFVKLKVDSLGEITKACSATLGESSEYVWRCE